LPLDPAEHELERREAESRRQPADALGVAARVKERRKEHVPGQAADAVEVGDAAHGALRLTPRSRPRRAPAHGER
jgi:hypothetical protein